MRSRAQSWAQKVRFRGVRSPALDSEPMGELSNPVTTGRRRPKRPGSVLAVLAVLAALILTSCGPAEEQDPTSDTSTADTHVGEEDGFWRDSSLPEPVAETTLTLPAPEDDDQQAAGKLEVLSADREGDFMRLVMAWLPPVDQIPLGSIVLSSHQHRYEATPFIRLVDRETNEMFEPLRGDSNTFDEDQPPNIESRNEAEPLGESQQVPGRGTCICSMLSGAEGVPPERTELIYVDFPAPEADVVDVVPGEWAEPIEDVPVTSGEDFSRPDPSSSWFFTHTSGEDPPEQYGAGARHAVHYPLAARSETLNGVVTTIEEQTQEVSLPSDVLFEFGSAELSDEAADVIESATAKLNDEASGMTVTIEGHTDNVDSAELNQQLSEDRAEAVAEVVGDLVDDSISLETIGYGYSRPQVPNTDADGDPIPENQERNRRVSFRYPEVVQEAGTEVNLGEAGVPDLPQARPVDTAEGAEASFLLEAPEGDTSETDVRFDVVGAQRDGDVVTLQFAIAAAEGDHHQGSVFSGNPEVGGAQHFGDNPQGDGDSPGLANMSLIDLTSEERYFPLSSRDRGCLCTEVAGTVETLPRAQSPLFAQFRLPEDMAPPVLVHLPDAGQFELPEAVVDQITEPADQ